MQQLHGKNLGQLVDKDPFKWFAAWFSAYKQSPLITAAGSTLDPNAMCLSTATPGGRPSARMVLLKDYASDRGFVFYSNYTSRKGEELAQNPFAALTFYWGTRQVRVEGAVSRLQASESDQYFASRHPLSQLGAVVSKQSRPLESRQVFEEEMNVANRHMMERVGQGSDAKQKTGLVRPDHWGGYVLSPDRIEFWEHDEARLHHRHVFTRDGGQWEIGLLYP